jgi:hypothetical protein
MEIDPLPDLKIMSCEDKNIKDFLPAYRDEALEREEKLRIEHHLDSCADCRRELTLLQLLHEDAVPDPGETFWSTMPARVFRVVQEEQTKKQPSDFARFWGLLNRYRLTAAAATMAFVFIVILSWFTARPPLKGPEASLSERYGNSDDIIVTEAAPVSELNPEELEAVGSWANNQLVSLSEELANTPVNIISEADIHDEIVELNTNQIERLSNMIKQWKQEG